MVTDHGVTFAGAGLAIGEEATIVAVPHVLHNVDPQSLIHFLLVGIVGIHGTGYSVFVGFKALML